MIKKKFNLIENSKKLFLLIVFLSSFSYKISYAENKKIKPVFNSNFLHKEIILERSIGSRNTSNSLFYRFGKVAIGFHLKNSSRIEVKDNEAKEFEDKYGITLRYYYDFNNYRILGKYKQTIGIGITTLLEKEINTTLSKTKYNKSYGIGVSYSIYIKENISLNFNWNSLLNFGIGLGLKF